MKIKQPKIVKLRWGVAGGSKITENKFLPAMKVLKRSSLAAIYSSSPERAKFLASESATALPFSNFDEFISGDFDVVYIAGSNDTHFSQVIKAAEAGKHVLCEKPVAMTAEESRIMYETCKANNVLYGVNFTYRYHPLVKKAKELISSQLIGRVVSINTDFFIDYPPTDNYRYLAEKGGGAFRDLASHLIDMQRFFIGEPVGIKGYMGKVIYNTPVDDISTGIIEFESSALGKFSVGFNAKEAPNTIEIIGHKGSICIENVIGCDKPAKLVIKINDEPRRVFRKRANKFLRMMRSVQKSFIKGETPLASGYDGYVNMKLIEEFEKQCR